MTEPEEIPGADSVPEDLGRSDDDLLSHPTWELDPIAEPTAAPVRAEPPTVPPSPQRIIEAILFVGGLPLTAERAAEAIRGLTPAQFLEAIETLNHAYRHQGRPYAVQARDNGFVLELRTKYRVVMERLYGSVREARLSPQAVDVLSLVAYRQPATKQEIDTIRGTESGSLLRQLVRRSLIAVVQRGEAQEKEVRYGTTARFLKLFGLQSLDDLPQTQDLQKI